MNYFYLCVYSGHYMVIDALYLAQRKSSSSLDASKMTSQTFQPASKYCVRFWYNMHGSDVKPIYVYTKVHLDKLRIHRTKRNSIMLKKPSTSTMH